MNKRLSLYSMAFLSMLLIGCTGAPSPWYPKGYAPTNLLWVKSGVSKELFDKDNTECWSKYNEVIKNNVSRGFEDYGKSARDTRETCFLNKGYKFTNYYDTNYVDYCRYVNPDGPACRSIGK